MANVQGTSLFNNSLLSDCIIRQTFKGATKDYYAHRAVLCIGSAWFMKALTGKFQEAKSGVIHVHDDDPIYFEILLRYLYEHKWDIATAQKKKAVKTWGSMSSLTLTAIGVYSLADKYEIEGLRACAIDQIPSPSSPSNPYLGAATLSDMSEVINTHYSKCIQSNCAMGRKLCLSIIKWMPEIAKLDSFIDLAKADPNLAMDMYFAGCENSGKLW